MDSIIKTKKTLKKSLIENFGLDYSNDNKDVNMKKIANDSLIVMKFVVSDGTPVAIPSFEFIFIGSIGSAYNIKKLEELKITHILCCAGSSKLCFPDKFDYCKLNMKDSISEDLNNYIPEAIEFIDRVRYLKGRILVHCFQGKSRSAALCCAYMITRGKMDYESAIDSIKLVRPLVCPNNHFILQLKKLEKAS